MSVPVPTSDVATLRGRVGSIKNMWLSEPEGHDAFLSRTVQWC